MRTGNAQAFVRSPPRELDLLPWFDGTEIGPARIEEIPKLVEMAVAEIPVKGNLESVIRLHQHDLNAVCAFRARGVLKGGIALLFLNHDGFDHLILDELDLSDPPRHLLAKPGTIPAAIYVWAIAAKGRGLGGIGNISHLMRRDPYSHADWFGQPATLRGAALTRDVGFVPMPSYQPNLWTYHRLVNRQTNATA